MAKDYIFYPNDYSFQALFFTLANTEPSFQNTWQRNRVNLRAVL